MFNSYRNVCVCFIFWIRMNRIKKDSMGRAHNHFIIFDAYWSRWGKLNWPDIDVFERYRFHEIISCCKHIPCTGTTKCILVLYLFISLVNLIFACLVPSNYVFSTHFETYKTEITHSIGFVLLDKFEKKNWWYYKISPSYQKYPNSYVVSSKKIISRVRDHFFCGFCDPFVFIRLFIEFTSD